MEFVSKQVAGLFLLYILHFAISDDSCVISKRMGKSSQYNDLVDDLTFAFPSYISECNSCSKIHSTDSKFEAHCLQNTSDGCNRRSYLAAHHLKENQTCALTAYLLKTKTVYCNKPHTNEEKLEFIELQAAGESAAVDNEEQPATEEVNENYHACGASASTTSSQSSPREELCFGKEVIYSDGIQTLLDRDFTGPLADSFNIYERIAFPDEEPNDE
ncbi:Hypothetical predicted protein [Cloeon dipterum]|uniref:Uncharacterized protein n=1 Tax=Cloeon dipterum TaxID=197152 RepID=A0A8S1DKS2_9INSE|nr:Hypothetical predicted protein [Cloeon dipterum]